MIKLKLEHPKSMNIHMYKLHHPHTTRKLNLALLLLLLPLQCFPVQHYLFLTKTAMFPLQYFPLQLALPLPQTPDKVNPPAHIHAWLIFSLREIHTETTGYNSPTQPCSLLPFHPYSAPLSGYTH